MLPRAAGASPLQPQPLERRSRWSNYLNSVCNPGVLQDGLFPQGPRPSSSFVRSTSPMGQRSLAPEMVATHGIQSAYIGSLRNDPVRALSAPGAWHHSSARGLPRSE